MRELSREDQIEVMKQILRDNPATPEEMPEPRTFSKEQVQAWIEQDEADARELELERGRPFEAKA